MPATADVSRRLDSSRPLIGRGSLALLLFAGLLLVSGCTTTSRPAGHGFEPPFPSPLEGPGVPGAPEAVRSAVADGWNALRTAGPDAALTASRRAGKHPLAVLLAYQAAYAGGASNLTGPLETLCNDHPDWASAWLTLSFAAEREGQTGTALHAAETAARSWPDPRWTDRASRLRSAWDRPLTGLDHQALEQDDPTTALAALDELAASGVENDELNFLRARALARLGRDREAREILRRLPETPESLALAASLAEREGDWSEALHLYSELPESWPGRARDLRRVKLLWRLDNMPPDVRTAFDVPHLDRARLATILVALVPEIETANLHPVPVMTDVVGIPEQREVIAVVRAGLMKPVGSEKAFHPEWPVSPDLAAEVIARLASFLHRPLPASCGQTPTPDCLGLKDPVSGEMARAAIWSILFPEEESSDHPDR